MKTIQTKAPAMTPFEQRFAEEYRESIRNSSKMLADPAFDLPMLPTSAGSLMKLLQDSNVSPKKIAATVQVDAVLTAKFLRMANSPLYAGTRQIDSVQVAIDRLGTATTRNVVMSISLNSTIVRERRLGEHATNLWQHANKTALAAQLLATRTGLMPHMAYFMGLMHDIGKLPAWIMVYNLSKRLPGVRPEVQNVLVEEGHVEIGKALMSLWTMPTDICIAVGAHQTVNSMRDAMEYIIKSGADDSVTDCSTMAAHVGCLVIAEKALGAIGQSDESCDLDKLKNGELPGEIGLNEEIMVSYLTQLPKFLQDHSYNEN